MEGRRRDAGRERLRASAFQRLLQGGVHPPRVQGEADIPVHAPAAAEDGGMAAGDGSGARSVFAPERPLAFRSPDGAKRNPGKADRSDRTVPDFAALLPGYSRRVGLMGSFE